MDITVIMCVFNEREKFLKESINSILQQSMGNFEFLIVNDGSSQNTYNLLESLKSQDSRIVLIHNKVNIGLTKSLNIALQRAHGQYIARMDSDDISHPDRLKQQLELMEENKDYVMCGCQASFINEEDQPIRQIKSKFNTYLLIKIFHPLLNQFFHSAFFIRKKVLIDNNIKYDEDFNYSQDYGLTCVLLKYGKLKNLSNL